MHTAFLSVGSNLGWRKRNIQRAIRLMESSVGRVARCSSFIETEPWGFQSAHRFINACVMVETECDPEELLCKLKEIEKQMGRTEKSHNGIYSDRIIDIDILLYDNITLRTPNLTIPHPQMQQRDFVMIPLKEIM